MPGSEAGDSQRAPNIVTESPPFILSSAALRKGVPRGFEGPIRPPAESTATLRTSEGQSAARHRAILLPNACPRRCAGPQGFQDPGDIGGQIVKRGVW